MISFFIIIFVKSHDFTVSRTMAAPGTGAVEKYYLDIKIDFTNFFKF